MPDADATAATASPSYRFITRARRLGAAGPLSLLTFILPPLGSFILLGSVSRLAPWLRLNPAQGLLIYLAGATICAALAFLPTFACAILGGWTFGFAVGFPASLAAFCAAAVLAYEINRRAAGDRVDALVRQRRKWEAIRVALLNSGFARAVWIITLLRLPPLSPFAPFNFLLGRNQNAARGLLPWHADRHGTANRRRRLGGKPRQPSRFPEPRRNLDLRRQPRRDSPQHCRHRPPCQSSRAPRDGRP